ncbi:hypothetical protein N9N03_02925 [Chlamydiia bacterium]|nr:hypothetical protein [Chlamydiia bacterium]
MDVKYLDDSGLQDYRDKVDPNIIDQIVLGERGNDQVTWSTDDDDTTSIGWVYSFGSEGFLVSAAILLEEKENEEQDLDFAVQAHGEVGDARVYFARISETYGDRTDSYTAASAATTLNFMGSQVGLNISLDNFDKESAGTTFEGAYATVRTERVVGGITLEVQVSVARADDNGTIKEYQSRTYTAGTSVGNIELEAQIQDATRESDGLETEHGQNKLTANLNGENSSVKASTGGKTLYNGLDGEQKTTKNILEFSFLLGGAEIGASTKIEETGDKTTTQNSVSGVWNNFVVKVTNEEIDDDGTISDSNNFSIGYKSSF